MMANILGQMPCSGNNLGTIGEGYSETVWDGMTPIFSIIINIINRLGEFHDIQRRPKKCIKKVYLHGYEPRGRGFNSCQPHHNKSVIEKQLRDQKSLGCFSLCVWFVRLVFALVSERRPKTNCFPMPCAHAQCSRHALQRDDCVVRLLRRPPRRDTVPERRDRPAALGRRPRLSQSAVGQVSTRYGLATYRARAALSASRKMETAVLHSKNQQTLKSAEGTAPDLAQTRSDVRWAFRSPAPK